MQPKYPKPMEEPVAGTVHVSKVRKDPPTYRITNLIDPATGDDVCFHDEGTAIRLVKAARLNNRRIVLSNIPRSIKPQFERLD